MGRLRAQFWGKTRAAGAWAVREEQELPHTYDDPVERERRRWTQENAHLYIRPDAHRFMRPDAERFLRPGQQVDRYWERPEHQSPAMRAYASPPRSPAPRADAAPAGYAGAASNARGLTSEAARSSGPSDRDILKLKSDLAALRVQLAVLRHENAIRKARGLPLLTEADEGWQIILRNLARYQDACRKAGFNPDQPRVSSCNPHGGQWTSGGGGGGSNTGGVSAGGGANDPRILSDATPDNTWMPGAQYAQNETDRHRSVILEDEPRFKHIKDGHIVRSDGDLLDELRKNYYRGLILYGYQPAEGSFTGVRSANDLINQTLQASSALVDRVASGELSERTLEHRFGYATGKEAFRPDVHTDPYIRKTFGVRVVIRHDPQRRSGYRLLTAFPINEQKRR